MMIILYLGELLHVHYFPNDDYHFCWPFGIHIMPVCPLLAPSVQRQPIIHNDYYRQKCNLGFICQGQMHLASPCSGTRAPPSARRNTPFLLLVAP